MPSNGDYTIKIVAQTDTTSFQQALRPLQEISKTILNINKAQSSTGTGGLVGAGASTSTSGIGTMAAGVKNAAGGSTGGAAGGLFGPDAAKNLQSANDALSKILANIKAIQLAAPSAAQAMSGLSVSAQGRTTATTNQGYVYTGAGGGGSGIGGNAGAVAASAAPGGQPPGAAPATGTGIGAMQVAQMAAIAVGGARSIVNEVQAGYSGPLGFAAEKNRAMSGLFGAAWGGDLNRLSAIRKIYDNGQLGDTLGQTVSGSAWVSRQIDAAGQGAKKILSNIPGLGFLSDAGSDNAPGGAGGAFIESHQASKVAGILDQNIKMAEEADSMILRSARSNLSANMGGRIQAQMVLGTGLGKVVERGVEKTKDTYNDLNARLTEQGFSVEQLAGTTAGLRSQVGMAGAGQMAGYVMSASAAGGGAVAGVMSAAGRAGGSVEAGMRFARTAMGGGIERFAGIGLGSAIAGQGYDPMGTTSGFGTLGAFQGGFGALGMTTGGISDFNLANRAAAGLQFGTSITTGGLDAYQRGRNLVEAMNVKPGGDIYTADYLSGGMNMKQMIDIARGGKLTTTAEMLGISQKDVRSQLVASTGSMLDRWTDTGGNTPMAEELRKIRASGKDWGSYLRDIKDPRAKAQAGKALTAFLGQETGQGEEAAAGLVAGIAGLDTKQLTTGDIGAGLKKGTAEAADAKSRADIMREESKALVGTFDELIKTMGSRVDIGKYADKAGQNLNQSVNEVVDALGRLVSAINPAAGAILEARIKKESSAASTARAAVKTGMNLTPGMGPLGPVLQWGAKAGAAVTNAIGGNG